MRNITLIVTPSRVKKLLSFCTRIWARARRTASKRGMVGLTNRDRRRGSGPCLSYGGTSVGLQPVLGAEFSLRFVRRDLSVAEHDDPAGMGRDVRLVRHHDDGLALRRKLLEDVHDFDRRRRVEVTRRFVGEEDGRL